MTTIAERWTSRRWNVGPSPTVELTYVIEGTTDDMVARQLVEAAVPVAYGSMPRQKYQLQRVGHTAWEATVVYGGIEQPDIGIIALDFSIGTTTVKITQALQTVAYAPPGKIPPDFQDAINVSKNGIDGVEIEIPTLEWVETWRHPDQSINGLAYAGAVYDIVGTVNNAPFRGFAAGEIRMRGLNGRKTRHDAWEFSYTFAASPNATNLTVGDITGIAKKGWEYLWVFYEDAEDQNAHVLSVKPRAAYVATVYRQTDFTALGIGN